MAVNGSVVVPAIADALTQLTMIETEFASFAELSPSAAARALFPLERVRRARDLLNELRSLFFDDTQVDFENP